MLKIFTSVVILSFTQILAQSDIDTLRSNDAKIQAALNYYNQQNYEEAKAMLERIIDNNEKNAEAHYYLSFALYKLKNLDDAIEESERAVELDNKNAEYHYNLGRLYGEETEEASFLRLPSKVKKLRIEAETALKLNPNHVGARILLSNFYFHAPGIFGGSYEKAIEQATIASKLDEWEGKSLLIRIYNKIEEYNKAEKECKYLEKTNSNDKKRLLYIYDNYGNLLQKQNRVDEAIENYKKAVPLNTDKTWPHNNLGYLYSLKGMFKEALNEYNKALAINPKSEFAIKHIEEISSKLKKK